MSPPYRLAILNSHPIQYFAPFYRRLAQAPQIDLTVYFCSHQGVEKYVDEGFGESVEWDVPLLDGYRYKFLPNWRKGDQVGGFFSLVNLVLVSDLAQHRYDALLVHGHHFFTYLLGILSAKILGIPILMRSETHLLLSRSPLKRIIRKPVLQFLYNYFCSICLPIGSRNREFYLAHGVREERLFTVPYAVDNSFFIEAVSWSKERALEIKTKLCLPLDQPLVLFASKLIPRKRPMDLLFAYERLVEQGVEGGLVYVGSGELEVALKRYVIERQIPNVFFLGFRNQTELPQIYAIADVFVLPSENEPWGLIINEAMCAGLPIIASAEIGAVSDLVRDDHNGMTFKTGDISELASHLRLLLTDVSLRRQMGNNSRALINTWDYDHGVQGLIAALQSLRKPA